MLFAVRCGGAVATVAAAMAVPVLRSLVRTGGVRGEGTPSTAAAAAAATIFKVAASDCAGVSTAAISSFCGAVGGEGALDGAPPPFAFASRDAAPVVAAASSAARRTASASVTAAGFARPGAPTCLRLSSSSPASVAVRQTLSAFDRCRTTLRWLALASSRACVTLAMHRAAHTCQALPTAACCLRRCICLIWALCRARSCACCLRAAASCARSTRARRAATCCSACACFCPISCVLRLRSSTGARAHEAAAAAAAAAAVAWPAGPARCACASRLRAPR
jgi:hypothetical protein